MHAARAKMHSNPGCICIQISCAIGSVYDQKSEELLLRSILMTKKEHMDVLFCIVILVFSQSLLGFLETLSDPVANQQRLVSTAETAHQTDRVVLGAVAAFGTQLHGFERRRLLPKQMHQLLFRVVERCTGRVEIQTAAV